MRERSNKCALSSSCLRYFSFLRHRARFPASPPSIRDLVWLEGTWQPTRLTYQRVADNKLTILVSGPGEDGQEQVLTYSLALKR